MIQGACPVGAPLFQFISFYKGISVLSACQISVKAECLIYMVGLDL
jgi:hypothetical protein